MFKLPARLAVCTFALAAALGLSACASKSEASGADARQVAAALANKRAAVTFYEQFFNDHDLSAAERYIAPGYIQHNPQVANGREAFVQTFAGIFAKQPQRRSTIKRVVAEGSYVMLHVHAVAGPEDRGVAVVDIFRFDPEGKIVEHWDVIQPVPEKTASGNGVF